MDILNCSDGGGGGGRGTCPMLKCQLQKEEVTWNQKHQDNSIEPPPQHMLILFFLFVHTAYNSCVSNNFKITRC